MQRREFITLLGGAAAAWPLAVRAQQGERMRRIGALLPFNAEDAEGKTTVAALRQGLEKLDWIEGRNIRIDYRFGGGDVVRTQAYASRRCGVLSRFSPPASARWVCSVGAGSGSKPPKKFIRVWENEIEGEHQCSNSL